MKSKTDGEKNYLYAQCPSGRPSEFFAFPWPSSGGDEVGCGYERCRFVEWCLIILPLSILRAFVLVDQSCPHTGCVGGGVQSPESGALETVREQN